VPFERSAGAIVFRHDDGNTLYLLLNYPGRSSSGDYWDLPKGNIERGEKPIETARREIAEETGLTDIVFAEGFMKWIRYFYRAKGKMVSKIVTFYLAETKSRDVTISYEHTGYVWLPYEAALAKLTFENAKGILMEASQFLSSKELKHE